MSALKKGRPEVLFFLRGKKEREFKRLSYWWSREQGKEKNLTLLLAALIFFSERRKTAALHLFNSFRKLAFETFRSRRFLFLALRGGSSMSWTPWRGEQARRARRASARDGTKSFSLLFVKDFSAIQREEEARDGSLLLSENPPSFSLPLTESGSRGVGRVRLGHDGVGHRRHRVENRWWGKSSELFQVRRRRGKGKCDLASERVEQNPKWLLSAVRDTCERGSRSRAQTAGGKVAWGSDNRHVSERVEKKKEER